MQNDFNAESRRIFHSRSGQILIEMFLIMFFMAFLFFEIQLLFNKSQTQRKKSEVIYESKN